MHKAFCKTLIGGAVALLASHSAWALLPIEHWTQDSGAQVWLVNSPTIPMVDVQINFDAGSRRDPASQAGLASAAAMMAAKGVKANGAQPALDENAVGEAWADLGATFEAAASNDALSFSLRSLTDTSLLGKAADLAARQMAQPSYDDAVWQRERERWNASIKEGNTRPPVVAARAFGKAVFGTHPYGQRATETTLTQIDPVANDSGTFGAKVRVNGDADDLLIGIQAKVEIVKNATDGVFTVPIDAVGTKEDGTQYVLRKTGGEGTDMTFEEVTVTTGDANDYYTVISGDDLKEGDVIRSSADLAQGIVTGSSDDSADFFFTAGGDEPIGGADAPAGGPGGDVGGGPAGGPGGN